MKRIVLAVVIALAGAGIVWGSYPAGAPSAPLSSYVPAGPLLYLEAKDFSSLLGDWNSSPEKRQWIESDSYEVFSRSRLFLRLKGAGEQFAVAAGLPPDMNFLSQVAGGTSALALYDIGNLQFLYITSLPSAKSMEGALWQSRSKFEPRTAGGVNFYVRRDPQSQRVVAFAVSGEYLLLATREDLMAGALQLISGTPDHTLESEPWYAQSTAAAARPGDLRLALNLDKLVPNGYFRTYWVQQNITDLSAYSAAVCDLFRSGKEYREERVLLPRKQVEPPASADGFTAAADLARLVPDGAGLWESTANPTGAAAFGLLETKLLAPHLGARPASEIAPQVQLTSGDVGGASDLETRIDQAPAEHPATQSASALQGLFEKTPLLASLQLQSTTLDRGGVFIRMHSAVVVAAASDWNPSSVQSALTDFVAPGLTASQLGVAWEPRNGYQQLDGLWTLALSVHGRDLMVSDDPALMETLLSNFSRKPAFEPAEFIARFNHQGERSDFVRFTGLLDRPGTITDSGQNAARQPQFFSANLASLSRILSDVSTETIEIREDGGRMRQSVTYQWSH